MSSPVQQMIEIDPFQPPFKTPTDNSCFFTRNGFCYSDEFNLIVDPETGLIGKELVYKSPKVSKSHLREFSRLRLREDLEWGYHVESSFELTESEAETIICLYKEATQAAYEALDGDAAIEHRDHRSYSISFDPIVSAFNWDTFFDDVIDRYRRDVTSVIPDQKLYSLFANALEVSIYSEYEDADRVVLEPADDWQLQAIVYFQAGVSDDVDQCKCKAFREHGWTPDAIAPALERDGSELLVQVQKENT